MRVALALMLVVLAVAPVRAATATATDLATTLVEHTRNTDAAKFVESIWPAQEQQLRQAYPQITQDVLDQLKQAFATEMQAAITEANKRAAAHYAEAMTEAELQTTLDFIDSEVGRKYLVIGQSIVTEMGAPFIQGVMQRFARAAGEILAAAQLGPPRVSN